MVKRIINNLQIYVNENEPNELYFPKSVTDIPNFDNDSRAIKEFIYSYNNNADYFPLSMLIELTANCNYNCPFCYIHTGNDANSFMSISDTKSLVDELVNKGMLFCTLSGGECLLYPEFTELYVYLKQKGVLVSVFSNGYLLNGEIIKTFTEYKPYKIEISIYGVEKEHFEAATCTRSDHNVTLNNVLKLKNAGLKVKCKTPVTNLTVASIDKIKEWCDVNGVDYYVSEEIYDSYLGKSVAEYKASEDELGDYVKKSESYLKNNNSHIYGVKKAWDCSAGKYSGIISYDHKFYPCMSCIGIKELSYSSSVAESIQSHAGRVHEMRDKKLEFCKGCNNFSICNLCIINVYKSWDNMEKCQYYRGL